MTLKHNALILVFLWKKLLLKKKIEKKLGDFSVSQNGWQNGWQMADKKSPKI